MDVGCVISHGDVQTDLIYCIGIPCKKFYVTLSYFINIAAIYVGHIESKERLRIQPAQLFNFS